MEAPAGVLAGREVAILGPLHDDAPQRLGRYVLFGEIAAGGTATVHVGRLLGPLGFSRTVAIKRLHPHLARDPDFSAMLLDEARLAARVRHPNVAAILDIVAGEGADRSLALVMELVTGESLARLLRLQRAAGRSTPIEVAAAIVAGVAHGLHAAHEAKGEDGAPLAIVHRDVSPQNVLLGGDGVPRLVDFGIAKASARAQVTREGEIKGKFSYMAPEQLGAAYGDPGAEITRAVDVYAAGLVLFELVTGARALDADDERALLAQVRAPAIPAASTLRKDAAPLDDLLRRALAVDPRDRFESARALALSLEATVPIATASQVGAWVESLAHASLAERAATIAAIERASTRDGDVAEERAPISREGGATVRVRADRADDSSAPTPVGPSAEPARDLASIEQGAPARTPFEEASVRTDVPARARGRAAWFALLALAAAALVAFGAIGARALGRDAAGTAPPAERAPSSGAPGAASATASSGTEPAAPPRASAFASGSATASTTAAPPLVAPPSTTQRGGTAATRASATPAASATATTATSGAPRAPAPPSATPPADCDPPYTVDSKGLKIYKVKCL